MAGYETDADNQLTDALVSGVNWDYEYDDEGRRTRAINTANGSYTDYTWDHRGRLVHLAMHTGSLLTQFRYTYDASDRRISKEMDSDGDGGYEWAERYSHDGADLTLVFNTANAFKARYSYTAGGTALGEVVVGHPVDPFNPPVRWYLADHQGSVREVVGKAGFMLSHVTYDPFGTPAANGMGMPRFGYTNQEWDFTPQMYHYDARYYDPMVGRFISQDPVGFAAGDGNLYRYVGNNTINYVDPTGLSGDPVANRVASIATAHVTFPSGDGTWTGIGRTEPLFTQQLGSMTITYPAGLVPQPPVQKAVQTPAGASVSYVTVSLKDMGLTHPLPTRKPPPLAIAGSRQSIEEQVSLLTHLDNATQAGILRGEAFVHNQPPPGLEWTVVPGMVLDSAVNALTWAGTFGIIDDARIEAFQVGGWADGVRPATEFVGGEIAFGVLTLGASKVLDSGRSLLRGGHTLHGGYSVMSHAGASIRLGRGQFLDEVLDANSFSASRNYDYPISAAGPVTRVGSSGWVRYDTPWRRNVFERPGMIDWELVRPEGASAAGMTNLQAAQKGFSPGRINPRTGAWDDVVLHHVLDDPRGTVMHSWRSTHSAYHQMIERESNLWRDLRPDWADAWRDEVPAYWKWRTGARQIPLQNELSLPGD